MKRKKSMSTLSKVSALLSKMTTRKEVGNPDEGEEFICPTCNLPVKPCEGHTGSTCPEMIKGETEMAHLERAEKQAARGEAVRCIDCGSVIPKSQLERNPLREVCRSCGAASDRKRALK